MWAVTGIPAPLVVDLCTGSGALAIGVATARPDAVVHAVEVDSGALSWARRNVSEHVGAGGTPVVLHAADVRWPGLLAELDSRADLVLCNPPYVPDGTSVPPEVAEWDPPGAVFGGPDGLDVIRAVIAVSAGLLRYGGHLAVEHDDTHGEVVPALLRRRRVLSDVEEHLDLAGRPRFATARRRVSPDAPDAPSADRRVPRVAPTYDCADPDARVEGLAAAARAVRAGRLVVLPTDTVYGLGCDAFSGAAVRALLAAGKRGPDMPVPVLVGSWSTIDGLVLGVLPAARRLIEAFWPGGLSLVLPHAPSLAWDLGTTKGTVMLRMPLHPVALELLRDVGPMAVSSANVSGSAPAASAAEAQAQLGDHVAVYLDGGPSGEPVASTVVDLTGDNPRILRAGAVATG